MADKNTQYNRAARLYPVIIVLFPVFLTAVAYLTAYENYVHYLTSALLIASITFLLRQLGRDQGKAKEPLLYEKWGSKPTTQLLSHQDNTIDELTKKRYHKKLQDLLPDLKIPTKEEELKNKDQADQIYESCTAFLRNKSRDTDKYPLVFEELTSYGFRRNLWGLKPIAIAILSILLIGNFSVLGYQAYELDQIPMYILILIAILIVMCALWVWIIRTSWVRIPAVAYAERLLEVLDD